MRADEQTTTGPEVKPSTLTEARAVALHSPARLGEIESALEQALARLFALQEAYPDLKASENFSGLQRDLVKIEEHLQYARRFYNGAVRDLNDGIHPNPTGYEKLARIWFDAVQEALPPPDDTPKIVTRDGSPPNAAMLSRTHSSAAT